MKNKMTPVRIYRDMEYEVKTGQQLEQARQMLNPLLTEWTKLHLGEIKDIFELVMNPEHVYKNTIDGLVKTPTPTKGGFALKKEAFVGMLELPDPSKLYLTAKAIRQYPFCATPNLWYVEKGKWF